MPFFALTPKSQPPIIKWHVYTGMDVAHSDAMSNWSKPLRRILLSAIIFVAATAKAWPPGVQELLMYEQQYVNRLVDETKVIAPTNSQIQQYSPE